MTDLYDFKMSKFISKSNPIEILKIFVYCNSGKIGKTNVFEKKHNHHEVQTIIKKNNAYD